MKDKQAFTQERVQQLMVLNLQIQNCTLFQQNQEESQKSEVFTLWCKLPVQYALTECDKSCRILYQAYIEMFFVQIPVLYQQWF